MENVVIIGGGPAGLSAAIYLARANLNPLVFAGSPPGGQLMLTSEVENYPGYESILGAELITKMRNQAIKLGARIINENVLKVELSKKPFAVHLSKLSHDRNFSGTKLPSISHEAVGSSKFGHFDNVLNAKSIIIATGARALWLGVPGEERLRGKGVSACATCDGFFFRNKTVAVIGGGDTALEEALTLTKFAEKIYLIHRRDSFRASKIMQEKVLKHPKIEVIWSTQVVEIVGKERVEGVSLKIVKNQSMNSQKTSFKTNSRLISDKFETNSTIKVDGIFVAIGHKPDTNLFTGKIELDEKGYVVTNTILAQRYLNNQLSMTNNQSIINNLMINKKSTKIGKLKIDHSLKIEQLNIDHLKYQSMTSLPGVFAAGDCVDSVYRQASTAMGMGVAAALDVERWLEE